MACLIFHEMNPDGTSRHEITLGSYQMKRSTCYFVLVIFTFDKVIVFRILCRTYHNDQITLNDMVANIGILQILR